jgi:protocatechuate 3,4-dioxygenase, beta subunit
MPLWGAVRATDLKDRIGRGIANRRMRAAFAEPAMSGTRPARAQPRPTAPGRGGMPMSESRFYPRSRVVHPPAYTPVYKTTVARSPRLPMLSLETTVTEETGPRFGHADLGPLDDDLIRNYAQDGEPIGERIIVHGRVLDENGRPVPDTLIEVWQANAGGRYRHRNDVYRAPIDPNFGGCGRCLTGEDGAYAFRTIKPGAYPWANGIDAWRPAHIHFSVFGHAFAQRLVTQMYFEGDPLLRHDAIAATIPDAAALDRLVAPLDLRAAKPMDALVYRFDIVLRGRRSTVFENRKEGN